MTPEDKESMRLDLIGYITGTVDEWLRLADFEPADRENGQAQQYRISWEYPTDGAMIASVSETQYNQPVAQFGIQVIAETLPDLPPVGPENDLGVYGVDDREEAPVWIESTMLHCLEGDRIRLGAEETTVLRSISGTWHADNSDVWRPKAWKHVELRLDLEANPGLQQYPPNAVVEILCTAERAAALVLQESFPGSAIVSSDVD